MSVPSRGFKISSGVSGPMHAESLHTIKNESDAIGSSCAEDGTGTIDSLRSPATFATSQAPISGMTTFPPAGSLVNTDKKVGRRFDILRNSAA